MFLRPGVVRPLESLHRMSTTLALAGKGSAIPVGGCADSQIVIAIAIEIAGRGCITDVVARFVTAGKVQIFRPHKMPEARQLSGHKPTNDLLFHINSSALSENGPGTHATQVHNDHLNTDSRRFT